MVPRGPLVHHRGMEFVADLIARHVVSVASPGFFAGAAVVILVLVSGLAARVIEIWEAMRPHNAERTVSTAWPTAERVINDFSDDGQKVMQEISNRQRQRVTICHTHTSSGSERTSRVAPCRISRARLPLSPAERAVSA
jgi:hypothetical protein